MERIAPWLALVLAAAIAVVAIVELDRRAAEDEVAIPTPIFTPPVTPAPTTPTTPVEPTPVEPTPVEPTPVEPTLVEPTAEVTPEPTPTPEPPRTPTPAPPETPPPLAAPVDPRVDEPTPHTGGGAVVPGAALAVSALLVRCLVLRRRRAY